MVLVKNWQFFYPFYIGKIGQQNLFENVLARKKAFSDYKNKRLKKWKDWDFSKRVNPWFWSKIGNFSIFFNIGKIGQENVFKTVLERKKAFPD